MSLNRSLRVGLVTLLLLGMSVGVVAALEVTPSHEHTSHEYHVEDVAYDEEYDIVWSIDNNVTEESVTFVGYDVSAEEVVVEETLNTGHAIADGEGVVYIADDNQLWEFDVESQEKTKLTEIAHHTGAMKYDANRDLLWLGQAGDVVALDASDGEEVMRHSEHGEGGIASLSVSEDYVASVRTWEPDPIVYDIENEEVAFEPLPESIENKEDGNIVSVHLTGSGKVILGGGWDSVFMYDIESQELQAQYAAHAFGAHDIEYLDSRNLIISTGFGNHVAFYDVEADRILETYDHGDTIYASDLDRSNDIIWYGDGEDPPDGTVTGLQMTFADAESGTETTATGGEESQQTTAEASEPTTTEDSEQATSTDGSTAEEQTEETATEPTDTAMEEATTATDSEGQPGMGPVAVVSALAVVLLLSRLRART